MASSPRMLRNDLASNRVFMRVEMDDEDVKKLSDNLRYASTQGAVTSYMQVREIAQESLNFLRSKFPVGRTIPAGLYPTYTNGRLQLKKAFSDQRQSNKLDEGWRVRLTDTEVASSTASLIGFRIYHIKETQRRAQVILSALNYGSRAFTITPKKAAWLKVLSQDENGEALFFWNKFLRIPARKGLHYIEATQRHIEKMYATRSDAIEDAIQALIDKGIKPESRLYAIASFNKAPRAPLRKVTARAVTISRSRNFMGAVIQEAAKVRNLRARLSPRT